MNYLRLICTLFIAALAGCQSGDHYYWGHYQDLLYVSYAEPGKISLDAQAQAMEADLTAAVAAGKPVPPGVHAHLGNLYYQLGKVDLARSEFETEERLYPESRILMDRMLATLSKK